MSNLVPTPRVNKHGHTVIKHMRPEVATSSSAVPAPAAPAIMGTEHADTIGLLQEAMKKTYSSGGYQHTPVASINDLWDRAEFMSMELATAYAEYITAAPNKGREALLMSVLNADCDEQSAGNILFIAQSAGVCDGLWNYTGGMSEGHIHADRMHRGLKRFSLPENMLSAERWDRARVAAAAQVTQAVLETDSRGIINEGVTSRKGSKFYLSQPNLAVLAMERPEDADAICEIIRERKVIDPETIQHLLSIGITALRDGAL